MKMMVNTGGLIIMEITVNRGDFEVVTIVTPHHTHISDHLKAYLDDEGFGRLLFQIFSKLIFS